MTDREKVIKGIHQHCEGSLFDRCGECPYYEIDFSAWEESKFKCRDELLSDTLYLLKEQEAIEPDVDSEGTCSCGNCGTTVGYYPAGCSVPEKLCKYCPECGHEVKWE